MSSSKGMGQNYPKFCLSGLYTYTAQQCRYLQRYFYKLYQIFKMFTCETDFRPFFQKIVKFPPIFLPFLVSRGPFNDRVGFAYLTAIWQWCGVNCELETQERTEPLAANRKFCGDAHFMQHAAHQAAAVGVAYRLYHVKQLIVMTLRTTRSCGL